MQLIPIVLVAAVVLAADGGLLAGVFDPPPAVWLIVLAAIGPVVAALVSAQVVVMLCLRRLGRGGPARSALAAERWVRICRWVIVINHAAAVLLIGWLGAVRAFTGDLVLVDELVAMLPALVGLAATWWVYYPLERRLREALIIRRLDEGGPLHAMPSRSRFVMLQLQVHILLMLVPILVILAVAEAIDRLAGGLPWAGTGLVEAATFGAALVIFMLAPIMARLVLSVAPLPPGPLREELLSICERHGVGVRDVLVWNTSGTMINAAVMGLLRPLRYVLLTDALLEMVPRPYLLAVMAHEIGHVRRRHLPWLVVTLMATLVLAVILIAGPLLLAEAIGLPVSGDWVDLGASGVEIALALLAFGWVCRRFERQADTFAVQHLSGLGYGPRGDDVERIDTAAVEMMRGALLTIAALNAVDPDRPSWRHGSIEWRRTYLQGLVGLPLARPPIDRVISRIKIAALVVLVLGGAALTADGVAHQDRPDDELTARHVRPYPVALHASTPPPPCLRAFFPP